ncbi:DUF397 domain-containing protein [Streptomyces sp. NPDC002431]
MGIWHPKRPPCSWKGHLVTTDSPCWFTSSYSENGGQCVEVAANLIASRGVVPVRDSKNPGGPVVSVPASSFASFVVALKSGEFGAV